MTSHQTFSKSSADAVPSSRRWQVPAVCLTIGAITFAVFGQTLTHDFVAFDDDDYVYNNPMVVRGVTVRGIGQAFGTFHAYNWHPLTWLSHMLDCQLYGLNPAGHHLTNVLLHCATAIALFLVLLQLTGALWRCAFVAAVFAVHPLRAESVAWVAERKDVLSGLFFVLTVGAYVQDARRPRSCARYGLVVFLFALGLMCKPMLVTLPLVLLLLDYWPLQRAEPLGKMLAEKLPLLALSAGSCVVTFFAQHGAIHAGGSFPLLLRLENALVTCIVYIGEMIWPGGLAVYYGYPHGGLPGWELILAGGVLGGITTIAFRLRRNQPWILTGWLWYLVMLLPVVGIVQAGDQAHADRYTYLPQIGICIALTWLVAGRAAQWHAGPVAVGGLMAGIILALMVCSWNQAAYWKDGETLWSHALECAKRRDFSRDKNGLYLAILHYNLGIALGQKGKVDESIVQYQEALESDPDYVAARINLGTALLATGSLDDAIFHFQKALQIDPSYTQAHNNLGNAFLQKGNLTEAIFHFQQAARMEPGDPWVKNNLAWVLATGSDASLRNGKKAVELAREANELTGGNSPVVLHTLAAALAEAGRFSEAVEIGRRAMGLAEAQSKSGLAGELESEIKLYQAGNPLRPSAQTH